MATPQFILGSKSPRRAQLLSEAGFTFDAQNPPFDDPPQPEGRQGQSPADLAMSLARQKAESLLAVLDRDCAETPPLVIAADSLCVGHDGAILGTPTTEAEARVILDSFNNTTHQVITGVALAETRPGGNIETFADAADVVFGHVTEAQIQEHLDSGQWQGKAGGYNLFERQAAGWPITTQGDPTTIVGLPTEQLFPRLAARGITGCAEWPVARD